MEKIFDKRHLLSLPEFATAKEFWLKELTNKQEETRLPYSFYPTPNYEGGSFSFVFPDNTNMLLEKASKNNFDALFVILASAYKIMLYKYTGQTSLEIGIPATNKDQLGLLENPQILPIYTNISPKSTFKEILLKEKETIAAVYHNQHYPLEEIEYFKTPKTGLILNDIHHEYRRTELDFVFDKNETNLKLEIKYNALLFSKEFIAIIGKKYLYFVQTLLSNAIQSVDELNFVEAHEEKILLNELNNTHKPYPSNSNLVAEFKKWALKSPHEIAVVMGTDSLTYQDLDLYSDRIAKYLLHSQHLPKGALVGILLPKSPISVACMLGILKAGGAYLPLSPKYPSDRIRMIINDSGLKIIISSKNHIKLLNKLQWECQGFETFLCIDTHDCHLEKEEISFKNELNDRKLWEYVGEKAKDDIEGGGWQNSYTGENISREEMDEYRDNIVKKLMPNINKSTRVLEIGCASGISMFELAPHTALYYGTDISRVIIERNQEIVNQKKFTNIKLKGLPAHEIDQIEEKDFDIVIINSVIQCFEGHNYLTDVLTKAVHLMKDKGLLFIGDIMNEATRETFIESLNLFKNNNIGKGYKVKTDFSNEIFYAKEYFEDLRSLIPGIHKVEFSDKIGTIENELTRFRYDAFLVVDKTVIQTTHKSHKSQHSIKELDQYSTMLSPTITTNANEMAYVIYTSGSTGKPKGVMASHKNVLRVVMNTNYVPFDKGDKILQAGPMEFDASTFDIWGTLTNGLAMHIIDHETFLNAAKLKAYIKEHKITTSFVITAAFIALIEQDIDVFSDLKYVLAGGEAMSTHHLNKLMLRNHTTQINNIYGPTENTVFSTCYLVTGTHKGAVPIGKPISNSTCYVLDQNQKLVMQGAEGVLYVGGDGVALGYLNSPELTQQRFVENPFIKGEKLYYTGDLVRWNENYEIEFIGRVDTQVKIRGFRIELTEIENELLKINSIREARVIVKKDNNGDKSLIGYYTATNTLNNEEILSILGDKLPEYMIPSALIQLDALPLNANGKLDIAKLPDLVPLSKNTFAGPENEIQEQLVEIWKEVLDLPIISINDNFFELGGHSLKAMKVLHKLSKNFELKLTHLFKYPTIRELSANLAYKKDNLLETLIKLKEEPLDKETIQKANEKKAWYKAKIEQDNFVLPGEECKIEEVLLTGSTGYLGIHLLREFIVNTSANVHVLIRADNNSSAKLRIIQKIGFYFGDQFYNSHSHRIFALASDMAKPNLGLDEETYQWLSSKIDTIVNPAANVKHYGQEADYQGNTRGVQELVKLAKTNRTKRLHHVSTAGVSFGQGYVFSEYDRVDTIPDENNTVYLQSKLEAEKIIFQAMEDGVEASVYRVGNLVFNNKTGKFQENTENSAFYMLLRSFINLGIMPDMKHKFYDFSFINTTAEAILKFAQQKCLINDVFHVYNAKAYSLNDLYHMLIKPNFPEVRLVSTEEFPHLILQKYEDPNMKEFIEHIIVNVRILEINESNVMLVSDRTQGIMDQLDIHWQALDEQLASMMIDFGKEKKFW